MTPRQGPEEKHTPALVSRPPRLPRWRRILRALVVTGLATFVLGGLSSGALFAATVVSLTRGEPRPASSLLDNPLVQLLPAVRIIVAAPQGTASGQDARNGATLPIWRGTERVNILLLGIDQRPSQQGVPSRTDTMLLVTVDPATKTAGILSMPRDLLVHIPGYGEQRINTAYFLGEQQRPARGPRLAKETVSANFGVPVHYYVLVDFRGFERIVDTLGGVTIDVPRPLKDDEYPSDVGDNIIHIFFEEGVQRMDGRQALRYARTRHADSDFGRNQRQQQVLLALRQEVLRLDILPRLPALLGALRDSFATDIPTEDALALAALAWRIGADDIQRRAVDATLVYDAGNGGLVPRRTEIAKIIRELFFDGRLRAEAARVEVLNGSARQGLASVVAQRLAGLGVQVVRVDSAERADYTQTVIVDASGKSYTTSVIARALGLPREQVIRRALDTSADVRVILGADVRS